MNYVLTILLLVTSLYAKQEEYSIIINEKFNNALLDITQNYDRTLTAVGFVKTYETDSMKTGNAYTNAFDYLSTLSNKHGSQIHLVKVGQSRDILQRESVKLSNFSEPVAITKTPNNGYFIGGYTLDGSLILLKINSNGNLIFSKKFGTNAQSGLSNVIALRDGGILAIGTSATTRSPTNDLFKNGLGLNDIYLTRFTKNGAIVWSKKYGTEHDDKGIDAVEAKDGSIVVLSQTGYDKHKDVTLMRITQNGDKVWLHHYKNDKRTTPHKIIKLRDNNFLVSLSQEDDVHKEQIRLIKFDIQSNILIDKEIYTTYSSILKDIKEYSNSNIIGVGNVKDKYNTDALAVLFDSELNMLNQEHFGDDNYDSFNRVEIMHNSQAAAVGINTDENSQESNMWLVKLNQDISIAQVSTKSVDFYEELSEIFKYEISSHKIELKEDLSIEFIDNSLYFKTAEYKLNDAQKKFLLKFSNKLLPFLYANKEAIDKFEINGHTSSEWAGISFENSFINNEKLSMNRSFQTLSYMYKNQDDKTQKWLAKVIKGSGLNFSEKVTFNNIENKERSRRVSFKIVLKN